ncbi:hypothetical protein B0H10DRAFT_1962062 [Mycena sp. CBHHK59/15]|nr:hypothetical protein B0H10DRAFT_1962062 [Mycena sp. CBHHK59/15]
MSRSSAGCSPTDWYSTLVGVLKSLVAEMVVVRDQEGRISLNAVSAFEQQFDAFWRREWPFDSASTSRSTPPLEYWHQLKSHKFSRVLGFLAVKIFSITINSMVDERTNSMLTWFNSPYRGRQTATTMESMVMVGQWYRSHEAGEDGIQHKKKKERKRPGVKFHDLDKTYLKSVQSRPHPMRTVDDSDSSDDESDLSDDNSDADDDEDEPGPRTRGRRARVILPAENITIDAPGINLSSPGLLAMITADGATSESPPTVTVSVALTPVVVESSRVDTTNIAISKLYSWTSSTSSSSPDTLCIWELFTDLTLIEQARALCGSVEPEDTECGQQKFGKLNGIQGTPSPSVVQLTSVTDRTTTLNQPASLKHVWGHNP